MCITDWLLGNQPGGSIWVTVKVGKIKLATVLSSYTTINEFGESGNKKLTAFPSADRAMSLLLIAG